MSLIYRLLFIFICTLSFGCISNGGELGIPNILSLVYKSDMKGVEGFLSKKNLSKDQCSALLFNARNIDMSSLLINFGADPKAIDSHRRTLLMQASQDGNIELTKFYINKGLNINQKDKYGRTALYYSAGNPSDGVAKLLIESGAYIDVQNSEGLTPLMFSASEGCVSVFKYLLENNADQNIIDAKGKDLDWYISIHRAYKDEEDIKKMKKLVTEHVNTVSVSQIDIVK